MSENSCDKARKGLAHRSVHVGAIAAAALSLVAVFQGLPVAVAEPDNVLPIVFHYHGEPSVPSSQTCEKVGGVDGFAVENHTVVGTAPGDTWRAPLATDASCAYPNPDGSLRYIGTETGTVTLAGCGTGLAVIEFDGLVTPPDANGVRTDEATFRILPAEGTDGMAGVSGGGTSQSTIYQDNSSDGLAAGIAQCPHPGS